MEALMGLFGNKTNSSKNHSKNVPKNGNALPKNSVNFGYKQTPIQSGGVAPTNFEYPANMRQPSEEVLQWATTAGLRTPLTGMGNVAHGGKRKNKSRKNKSRKNKSVKRKARKIQSKKDNKRSKKRN